MELREGGRGGEQYLKQIGIGRLGFDEQHTNAFIFHDGEPDLWFSE